MADNTDRRRVTAGLVLFAAILGGTCSVAADESPQNPSSALPAPPPNDPAEQSTPDSRYVDEVRDVIDAAAPSDAKAAKLLRQAELLIAEQKWDRAQEVLLFTLDRSEGVLVRLRGGQLVSVSSEANRLLKQLPEDALALYRRRYGPAAENALATAIKNGNRDELERVAVQFRHTEAGGRALLKLALAHFDRGEFGLAAIRFGQLDDDELDPEARVRAAYSFAAAGNDEEAARLLAMLSEKVRTSLARGQDLNRLIAEASARPATILAVTDWTAPFGDAAASALARPGEPVLLRRWSHPLTDRPAVQEQIFQTEQDLHDDDRATIPAAIPLAVGDRAVVRTLHGLGVYSIATGQLLWESAERNTAEDALTSGRQDVVVRPRNAIRFQFQFGPNPSGNSNDNKPLTNLLFRDGVRGFVTSDGQRIFAIEGGTATATNQLVAYDLETGRPAWSEYGALGGLLNGGPFQPPLAGYTFLGPPVPVADELYVIGENEKEIRLIAIDPATGGVRWNRLIAHAQTGIDQDPVRRDWPALASASDGVLVCPTTMGWVVGIDMSSRSILWARRYASPRTGNDANEMNAAATATHLNHRWCPSAPMIHQGRVFLTPAEETRLICLDLYSGDLLWQRDKGTGLYGAGISKDLLIVVGTKSVEGVDLASGAVRWTLPIPDDAGLPSGRAVLTEKLIYLPLQRDTLWQIDAESGELLAQKQLRPGNATLGNLVMHHGTLLSYSTAGLAAFEERTELARRAAARRRENPDDAATMVREAELRFVDGDVAGAAKVLDDIDSAKVGSGQSDDWRRLRWDVLAALARSEHAPDDVYLSRLSSIAETPEERLTVRRLEADRASAAGDVERAARAYLELLRDVSSDTLVAEDELRRQVRLTDWLAGRFLDLWGKGDAETRGTLEPVIRDALQTATTDDEQERLATIFAFHPQASALSRSLAADELAAGRYAAAQIRLLPLVHNENADIATAAIIDLAAAAAQFDLTNDARHWRHLAEARKPSKEAPESTDSEQRPEPYDENAGEADQSTSVAERWGQFRLKTVRAGGYTTSESPAELIPDGSELPYFRDRRMRLLSRRDHLAISGGDGAGLEQIIPLPTGIQSSRRHVALAAGHLLFLLHDGMILAVSPVEGRVLWSEALAERTAGGFAGERSPSAMRPAGSLTGTNGLIPQARTRDALTAATASYIAVCGRGTLSVRHPLTGDVRWTRDDLPNEAIVVGTESILYVLPRQSKRRMAFRTIDGQAIPVGQAGELLPQAVAAVGDRLLTVVVEEPPFPLSELPIGRRAVAALRDPQTGRAAWTRAFPSDTLFDVTRDGRLFALTSNGDLTELDAETGKTTKLGAIPTDVLRGRNEAYLLTDADSTYVVVNVGRGPSFFAAEMPAIPAGGHIFAFDRDDGELRWQREVSNQRLLCQEFDHLPVLLLIDSERTNKGGQGLWRVDLLALDKRTGQPVLDEPYYTTSTPFFHALTVQPDRRSIELSAYHTRLRLQAVPASAADDMPAGRQPPTAN